MELSVSINCQVWARSGMGEGILVLVGGGGGGGVQAMVV